jgi:probable blue pigment (indigoidine) exporter
MFFRFRSSSLCLIAAATCWGVGSVISKRAVDEIDPLLLLPIELSISCVTLLVSGLVLGTHALARPERSTTAALLGVLNPGLSYALSLAGLATVSASVSVLLWALEPLLIVVFAWLLYRDRITLAQAGWSLLAVTGVGLVVARSGSLAAGRGVSLIIAGLAACGVYSVLSGRLALDASALSIVVLQQIAAFMFSVTLLAVVTVIGHGPLIEHVSVAGWVSAGTAGILYYGVAFWFYLRGVQVFGAIRAGVYINLVPLFGLAASSILLNERLHGRQWIGAGLVIVAVIAFSRSEANVRRSVGVQN